MALCSDYVASRTICIFKDSGTVKHVLERTAALIMEGSETHVLQFEETIVRVKGFVKHEPYSLVKGYILEKKFYGTIRIYDKYRLYHVLYHVEPISNVVLYNKQTTIQADSDHNAVIFEYVSRSVNASWIKCTSPPLNVVSALKPVKPNTENTTNQVRFTPGLGVTEQENLRPVGPNMDSKSPLAHSTILPPYTGPDVGKFILRHSTDKMDKYFFYHSTTVTSPVPISTTPSPVMYHSTDITTVMYHHSTIKLSLDAQPTPANGSGHIGGITLPQHNNDKNNSQVKDPPVVNIQNIDPAGSSTEREPLVLTLRRSTEPAPLKSIPQFDYVGASSFNAATGPVKAASTLDLTFLNHSTVPPHHSTAVSTDQFMSKIIYSHSTERPQYITMSAGSGTDFVKLPVPSVNFLWHSTTRQEEPFHSTMGHLNGTRPTDKAPVSFYHSTPVKRGPYRSTVALPVTNVIKTQTKETTISERNLYHSTPVSTGLYHSTSASVVNHIRRRKRREILDFFKDEYVDRRIDDPVHSLRFPVGQGAADIFDLRNDNGFTCHLCVYVQPHFAEAFGLGGGTLVGVAEIVDLITFVDSVFRSLDFNQDGIPENIGFKIRRILVTDTIQIPEFQRPKPSYSNTTRTETKLPKPNQGNAVRKKRGFDDDGITDILQKLENVYDNDGMFEDRSKREEFDFDYDLNDVGDTQSKTGIDRQGIPHNLDLEHRKHLLTKDLKKFSTKPVSISPAEALAAVTEQLQKLLPPCCATLAFVYHDMGESMTTANTRSLCEENNVALITGLFSDRKLLKYDIFRSIMHVLGHVFGASHDRIYDPECLESDLNEFINHFPMHHIHQSNIGMRFNSFRYSPCAGDQITLFLASSASHCLAIEDDLGSFCGNGMLESEEVCDCGSLWQCHQASHKPCCGESDTFWGCKITEVGKQTCRSLLRW